MCNEVCLLIIINLTLLNLYTYGLWLIGKYLFYVVIIIIIMYMSSDLVVHHTLYVVANNALNCIAYIIYKIIIYVLAYFRFLNF